MNERYQEYRKAEAVNGQGSGKGEKRGKYPPNCTKYGPFNSLKFNEKRYGGSSIRINKVIIKLDAVPRQLESH